MNSMKRLLSLALLAAMPLTALAKDEASKIAGTYKGETRAKGESRDQSNEGTYATRHHTMTLDLGKDGTATLTQSPTGADEITSFATRASRATCSNSPSIRSTSSPLPPPSPSATTTRR